MSECSIKTYLNMSLVGLNNTYDTYCPVRILVIIIECGQGRRAPAERLNG